MFPIDEILETFEAAYCAWWSSMVIGEDEVLRTFSTAEHMDTIEKFPADRRILPKDYGSLYRSRTERPDPGSG